MSETGKSLISNHAIAAIIGTAVALCTVPAFGLAAAGWTGLGQALLVGAGCYIGSVVCNIASYPLRLLTAGIGYMLGSTIHKGETGRTLGALCTLIPATIFGATQGYSLSKDWLTAAAPANAPVPAVAMATSPVTTAPATTVTVQRVGA